jgi:hypothetical protein
MLKLVKSERQIFLDFNYIAKITLKLIYGDVKILKLSGFRAPERHLAGSGGQINNFRDSLML